MHTFWKEITEASYRHRGFLIVIKRVWVIDPDTVDMSLIPPVGRERLINGHRRAWITGHNFLSVLDRLNVHGMITSITYEIDFAHAGDTIEEWTVDAVKIEAERLVNQLYYLGRGE